MYKRLLVAADGSKNSVRAAEEAAKLARLAEGAVVEVIYVMDYSKSKGEVLQSRDGEMLEAERRKKLVPVEDVFVKSEVPYKVTILYGDPGPAIVEYVNKSSCDMLLIGSRGLNTLQEMVLGSVSHKVAKRVDSPVLIVK
ncbi:universal stress protein [Bacillus norwichensis]|uniref:Universal stress protein n=1 Tax=Bacillus norwichensis TaxID=2762217 RepID=A0ABR8VMM8_9BACI|nr:universal stress protein [Bacillus norwichensis]MBD8006010.1 universal stress protein [Bacillus norwichensis]